MRAHGTATALIPPAPRLAGAQWALFLDVDGTLLEFEDDPTDVVADAPLRQLLMTLHRRLGGALALVSGRTLAELDRMFAPERFCASGVHGSQIRLAGERLPVASPELPADVRRALRHFVRQHPALILEEKPSSVCLHYRRAPQLRSECREKMDALAARATADFELLAGKCVLELTPRAHSKGTAIDTLRQHAPFKERVPVYLGDDAADEDAFAAVNALGGLSVRVGAAKAPTQAQYVVADVPAARSWLQALATRMQPEVSGRLVMVSNRVGTSGAGGMAVVIAEALRACDGLWFGWDGNLSATASGRVGTAHVDGIEQVRMSLSRADQLGYYAGYSNGVLWPACHDATGLMDARCGYYAAYQAVNRLFARRLAARLRADDTLWIHDYHLIPLACALRELGVGNAIGFSMHAAFPSPEALRAVPEHRQLLTQLDACDLIGVQSERDLQALRSVGGGAGKTGVHGVGIDVRAVRRMARDNAANAAVTLLTRRGCDQRLIVGVDRLDYSKGLVSRLRAIETVLARRPALHGKVVFVQVCAPTRRNVRHYDAFAQRVQALARRINDRFATPRWQPLRWVDEALPRPVVAGLLRHADVGLVTPGRDGMNLVAMEFVAAQPAAAPGVLVLSREAGAAARLGQAVVVAPTAADIAGGLERALSMPLFERRRRQGALWRSLGDHSHTAWRERFVTALMARAQARLGRPPCPYPATRQAVAVRSGSVR